MKAMIFAAGLGTRFKPWTDSHPKALAMVNGKSLLQRNVEYLQQYGISDLVVNVHHFSDQVIEAIEQHDGWGSNIVISDERDELLETGGGLLKARALLESGEPFLTLNADILTKLPIDQLIAHHQQHHALISLAVSNRESSRNFLFDESMKLSGWQNNKTGEEIIVNNHMPLHPMAYNCVAVFDPAVFDLIPQRGKFSLTTTFLSLAEKHLVSGFDCSADAFIDVGKPESVVEAERMFR
jgi:MurNAc alpha-1-phosphate uridylyltransferase